MGLTEKQVQDMFVRMQNQFNPEKAVGVDAVIQFDLSGDPGGLYWARVQEDNLEMGQGPTEEPSMTLLADVNDFSAVINGEEKAMQAFMSGKIKVKGDMSLALKLQAIFNL